MSGQAGATRRLVGIAAYAAFARTTLQSNSVQEYRRWPLPLLDIDVSRSIELVLLGVLSLYALLRVLYVGRSSRIHTVFVRPPQGPFTPSRIMSIRIADHRPGSLHYRYHSFFRDSARRRHNLHANLAASTSCRGDHRQQAEQVRTRRVRPTCSYSPPEVQCLYMIQFVLTSALYGSICLLCSVFCVPRLAPPLPHGWMPQASAALHRTHVTAVHGHAAPAGQSGGILRYTGRCDVSGYWSCAGGERILLLHSSASLHATHDSADHCKLPWYARTLHSAHRFCLEYCAMSCISVVASPDQRFGTSARCTDWLAGDGAGVLRPSPLLHLHSGVYVAWLAILFMDRSMYRCDDAGLHQLSMDVRILRFIPHHRPLPASESRAGVGLRAIQVTGMERVVAALPDMVCA